MLQTQTSSISKQRKERLALQERELDLFKRWKNHGDSAALSTLVESLKPIVSSNIMKLTGGALPREVLEAQGMKYLMHGLKTFNPKKGVKLSTHITNQLLPLHRVVYTYSNVARVPENRIQRIRLFQQAQVELQDKFKRRPSIQELADHLSWSPKLVSKVQKDLNKDLLLQTELADLPVAERSPRGWAVDYLYYSLSPKEKPIFEDLTGYGGVPQKSDEQIMRTHKVSRAWLDDFKNRISDELNRLFMIR